MQDVVVLSWPAGWPADRAEAGVAARGAAGTISGGAAAGGGNPFAISLPVRR